MNYRIEKDTLGEIKVPADRLWGAQTQRSKENFPIGSEKMPLEVIQAFAVLKKARRSVTISWVSYHRRSRTPLFMQRTKFSQGGLMTISRWLYGRQEAVRSPI